MGLSYRFLQFQRALLARPTANELELAARVLTPEQFSLFLRLQPSEQAHSLKILHALRKEGQVNPELLAASLLHDVGKSRHPLKTWERVAIVLANVFLPKQAGEWGNPEPGSWGNPQRGSWGNPQRGSWGNPQRGSWGFAQPTRWKRPFVVARQHPAWGAEMAAEAGASDLLVELIRRHQDPLPAHPASEADRLLAILKKYDDQT